MGVGSKWGCPSFGNDVSHVNLRVRADCGGRLFLTKLPVIVHYLLHQLLDHLLADDAILLARQFCDCLRDRVNDFICFSSIDFV